MNYKSKLQKAKEQLQIRIDKGASKAIIEGWKRVVDFEANALGAVLKEPKIDYNDYTITDYSTKNEDGYWSQDQSDGSWNFIRSKSII